MRASAARPTFWLEPELIEQPDLMQVKLILHIVSAEDMAKRQENVVKELTERQVVIIGLIDKDAFVSAKKIANILSEKEIIAERTIQRDLAVLKDLGVLTRIGGRKDGYWKINKELLPSIFAQ